MVTRFNDRHTARCCHTHARTYNARQRDKSPDSPATTSRTAKQTLLLLHRHSVGWSSFTLHAASCFCRGLSFWGSLERHRNSFMVFMPSSITRCYGRDRRVEEDGGRQTGRGRWRKISVELEKSAMQTDTAGVASPPSVGWSSLTRHAASCLWGSTRRTASPVSL